MKLWELTKVTNTLRFSEMYVLFAITFYVTKDPNL